MTDNKHEWVNVFFTDLYTKHNMHLRSYVRSLPFLRDSEDIDDIVSTTFKRVYIRLCDLSLEEIQGMNMWGYLKRTAKHAAIDLHRKRRREHRDDLSSREKFDDDSILDDMADNAPQPEEIYEEKEKRERLAKAIAKLPENLRIVVQGFLEEKTREEIGNEIGRGAPAVGCRERKAWQILRDMPEIQQIRNDY